MREPNAGPAPGLFQRKTELSEIHTGNRAGTRLPTLLQAVENPFICCPGAPLAPCSRGRIELLVMLPLPFPRANEINWNFCLTCSFGFVFFVCFFFLTILFIYAGLKALPDLPHWGWRRRAWEERRGFRDSGNNSGEIRPARRSQEPQHAATSIHLFYTRGKFGERGKVRHL